MLIYIYMNEIQKWEFKVERVANGYVVSNSDGITYAFEAEETDDNEGDIIAFRNVIECMMEEFGQVYSKHNAWNIVVDTRYERDDYDESQSPDCSVDKSASRFEWVEEGSNVDMLCKSIYGEDYKKMTR